MATVNYKSLFLVFAALIMLLIATIAIYFVPLGQANTWLALGIAGTKTLLVVIVFMGLARSSGAMRLAAGAGVLWLTFAVVLVMADYMTRGWNETQVRDLRESDHYTTYDRVEYSSQTAE